MAHGVKAAPTPKLHQALHGYAEGHRQLALSAALKPRDQKTVLALSDISGPGARLNERGYVTGYPLAESGSYALARTWPAPEMPRPGCVWTHTLLIDFTDLAALDTLTGLLSFFRRPPSASAAQDYGKPLIVPPTSEEGAPALPEHWARQIMAGLYAKPQSRIVAARNDGDVDLTVLAIWSQQWPRLRRGFRFCTFTTHDRSADGSSFDLQLLPSADRSVRSRFSDVVDAEAVVATDPPWLDDALHDLLWPDVEGLRSFFRRLGADVGAGRESFRPLCRLHRAISACGHQPAEIQNAIAILQNDLGTKQARTARSIVAEAALGQADNLNDEGFAFLWDNLGLVDGDALAAAAASLGRTAWRREPALLAAGFEEEGARRIVAERALDELELKELVEGLARATSLRPPALARRPELVGRPAFWTDLDLTDEAFRAAKSAGMEAAATAALVAAGRHDLARRAVQEFGAKRTLQTLAVAFEAAGDRLAVWLHASVEDTSAVAHFLANQSAVPRSMLGAIAHMLPPDAVPNDYGADPWLLAQGNAIGAAGEVDTAYLAAYLLSRALGPRSRSSGELAQLAFETTHRAVAVNRLPDDAWRLLESRLPWSVFWFEWDRCQRLRAGVTNLFMERDLAPALFAQLVQSDQLFLMLADGAAWSRRGRSYLRCVHRTMKDDRNVDFTKRIRAIEKLLG